MHNRNGFSLVELSIVLVILGLLVGGILGGRNLIKAAELRSVTTEHESFLIAINTFKDKHLALPGDIRNAAAFWTEAASGCTYVPATASGTETCNGNGNGRVGDVVHEEFLFWQHLANAGLITGNFNGQASNADDYQVGINHPNAKLNEASWSVHYIDEITNAFAFFDGPYGNYFYLADAHDDEQASDHFVLLAEDQWNIDTKVDDGMPTTGSFIGTHSNNNCAMYPDGSHPSDFGIGAIYNLAADSAGCALIIRDAF